MHLCAVQAQDNAPSLNPNAYINPSATRLTTITTIMVHLLILTTIPRNILHRLLVYQLEAV